MEMRCRVNLASCAEPAVCEILLELQFGMLAAMPIEPFHLNAASQRIDGLARAVAVTLA